MLLIEFGFNSINNVNGHTIKCKLINLNLII